MGDDAIAGIPHTVALLAGDSPPSFSDSKTGMCRQVLVKNLEYNI
jgi:hypothetical protein